MRKAIRFGLPVLMLCGTVGCHSIGNPFVKNDESEKKAEMLAARKSMKNPGKVYLWYGRVQEQAGEMAEAKKSYNQVLEVDSKSIDAKLGLARIAQREGKLLDAERRFEQVLKQNPKNAVVLDGIGEFYASQGRWNEAVNALTAASAADPTQSIYRYHLATATAKSGDLAGAFPHYVKSVGEGEAHYNIGHYLYERGELEAAEQQFELALQKKPGLPHAQQMLAIMRPKPTTDKNGVQLASGVQNQSPRRRPIHRSFLQQPVRYQRTQHHTQPAVQQPIPNQGQQAPQQPFPHRSAQQHDIHIQPAAPKPHDIQIRPGVPTAKTSQGGFQAPIVRGHQPITPPNHQMVAPELPDWHSR